MVDVGDTAPDFTAPLADGDVRPFTLSEHLDEAPIVLVFFPAAFTGTCTTELRIWEERLNDLDAAGATIYGVSVDTPFSLNEFRERNGITYGVVSDSNKEIIDDYGVRMDFDQFGYYGVAKRAVFVVGDDDPADGDGAKEGGPGGEIAYRWVSDDPGVEPNYDEVIEAAADA